MQQQLQQLNRQQVRPTLCTLSLRWLHARQYFLQLVMRCYTSLAVQHTPASKALFPVYGGNCVETVSAALKVQWCNVFVAPAAFYDVGTSSNVIVLWCAVLCRCCCAAAVVQMMVQEQVGAVPPTASATASAAASCAVCGSTPPAAKVPPTAAALTARTPALWVQKCSCHHAAAAAAVPISCALADRVRDAHS